MAGTLKTTFFNLVKYAANDITSWLTDFNGNMDKIDAAMNQNKTAAQTAQDGVDNLEAEYESLLTVVNGNTTSIEANEKATAANSSAITSLENNIKSIEIGELIRKIKTDATIIEPLVTELDANIRKLGNFASGTGSYYISNGTLHSYDRVGTGIVAGKYITDLFRFTGNPFSLNENVYTVGQVIGIATTFSNFTTPVIVIAYLADSNYTLIGLAYDSGTPATINSTFRCVYNF